MTANNSGFILGMFSIDYVSLFLIKFQFLIYLLSHLIINHLFLDQ